MHHLGGTLKAIVWRYSDIRLHISHQTLLWYSDKGRKYPRVTKHELHVYDTILRTNSFSLLTFRNGHFSGFSRDLEVWLLFPFFALVLVHTVEKTSGDSFLRRNSDPFWCAFWIRACNAVRSTNTSHPSSSCTVFFLEFCKSEDNINEQHVLKAISHNETI